MKNFNTMTVGEIIACNYEHAATFRRYDIDFFSKGNIPLKDACQQAGIDLHTLLNELESDPRRAYFTVDFQNWPTDLLLDYIQKFHHRRARSEGALINELIDKVTLLHVANHPELPELRQQVHDTMADLEIHLNKEEQILFPYISELNNALAKGIRPSPFHCGSIKSPIAVMMADHEKEGERYRDISRLTNQYTTPDDGCGTYHLLMERMKLFQEGLQHHIHLENNILFPRAIDMEQNSQFR